LDIKLYQNQSNSSITFLHVVLFMMMIFEKKKKKTKVNVKQ